jgi:anti-sigma regulatory factor (Ser/Thr protein kinase)
MNPSREPAWTAAVSGMPGEPAVKQSECRLTGEAAQVRAARQFVAEFLGDDWPDVDTAVLLTSELAANAVLHSASGRPGGKFTVRATVQPRDYLWVEVEDEGGPWTQTAGHSEPGHGLDIVRAIADDWGKDGGPATGWIVWARVDFPCMSGAKGASDGRPGWGRDGPPGLIRTPPG